MDCDTCLLINDINRMSESLTKVIVALDNNEIEHDHELLVEGLSDIQQGTSKVVTSFTNQ